MGPIVEDALASGSARPQAGTGKVAKKSATMESLEDIGAGSIAGVVGKYIEYPFDTVKVRLQSQPDRYSGPIDCFRQSIRADGFVNGLYRGITAPLVGAALENSSMFFFERMGRELVYASGMVRGADAATGTEQAPPLPLSALYLTGAFAGTFTSFVLTPIELVKCKIQAPVVVVAATAAATTTSGGPKVATAAAPLRPLSVIRDIYRAEGLLAFWHGQLGTLIREGGGGAAWFGAKETVSKAFASHNASLAGSPQERERIMRQPLPLWQQAVAGAAGGVLYNFLFFPADTIKSRMQTVAIGEAQAEGGVKKRFWSEGVAIWRQYGLRGLYRGCGITCLRSAPSSAFIFIVYDGLKQQLDKLH